MSLGKDTIESDLKYKQNGETSQRSNRLNDNKERSYQRFMGILPAFRHVSSGETHLSCEKDGTLAPVHQVDFLPSKWLNCNLDNSNCKLKDNIEKGYVVMGHFFNQEETAHLLPH